MDASPFFDICVKINIKEILILKYSHLMAFLGHLMSIKRLILRILKILILKVRVTSVHFFAIFVDASHPFERYM